MPSKESLERAQKFLDESFRFVATNYVVAPLADLLDEAIREARVSEAKSWATYWHEHDCIDGISQGHGGNFKDCGFCVEARERLAQLREGKT